MERIVSRFWLQNNNNTNNNNKLKSWGFHTFCTACTWQMWINPSTAPHKRSRLALGTGASLNEEERQGTHRHPRQKRGDVPPKVMATSSSAGTADMQQLAERKQEGDWGNHQWISSVRDSSDWVMCRLFLVKCRLSRNSPDGQKVKLMLWFELYE